MREPRDDSGAPESVAGRQYLLRRLDGLVAAGALDPSSSRRVREVIVSELVAIAAEHGAADREFDGPEFGTVLDDIAAARHADEPAPRPSVPAGPTALEEFAAALRTFATEQTPSLLLYIGAFLVVVAAFIFVNVSGDQISDLVKLVLMLAGTGSFLAAGIVCHRFPRVLAAGRTFLVIGALIAPLDVVAYYVLVARASPVESPTLWLAGSVVCVALYAALRSRGYGVGYSYLFYVAVLSTVLSVEALARLPLAWAPVPIAALAPVFELLRRRSEPPVVATLFGPLQRMTIGVASLATVALLVPASSSLASDRAAIPVEATFLTLYYFMRAPKGASAERVLATVGPAAIAGGIAYAAGLGYAALGLISALIGAAYLAHELSGSVATLVAARTPWATRYLTRIGLGLLAASMLPFGYYASEPLVGALAFLVCGVTTLALSLTWDGHDGDFAQLPGSIVLAAGGVLALVSYRFGLAATGMLPIASTDVTALARAYAPLSFVAWTSLVPLRRRPAHARVAALFSGLLTTAVSVGTYRDATVHTVVNALFAFGAAGAAVRLAERRALWAAGIAAMLSAVGAYRWSGAEALWLPLFALVPGVLAALAAYAPPFRALRGTCLQVATVSAVTAAGIGLSATSLPPWDTAAWRTTMIAIAAAGAFAALEAWRQRSRVIGIGAGLAVPVLAAMAVLTQHPTLPEPLTAPFAVYAFAAAMVAARSRPLRRTAPFFEYAGALLAVTPTVARSGDFGTLIVSTLIAFALLAVASRWQLVPTARVALLALLYLAVTRVYVDPRLDEIRIAAGAALLAMCVFSLRTKGSIRLPEIPFAELVAAALIVVPTAVVTFLDPGESHLDIPIPLLLCIELGALYAVATGYQRLVLMRALIGVSLIAALEFLALQSYGEWYAALLGSAMINVALAMGRRWPRGRELREHAILGVVGVGILFLPSLGGSATDPTLVIVAQVLAGGLAVAAAAALLGERWIAGAALGVIALESVVVVHRAHELQVPGVLAGAALIAIATAFPRFSRRGLPIVFSSVMDLLGLWLFIAPTLKLAYMNNDATQHAILMAQAVALTVLALALRRRWLILVAIGTIGLETVRAIFEVVHRVPSFATFAISGALLLSAGFLLLLKREMFERWRQQILRWWTAWLAQSS